MPIFILSITLTITEASPRRRNFNLLESGHNSRNVDAQGGFVAGGGSASGTYDKGYNNGKRIPKRF